MTPYERQKLTKLCYGITSLEALAKLEDYLINKCNPSDEEKEIVTAEIKDRCNWLQAMQDRRNV